jgi:ABC-2 type transport system ATP-binding protein
MIVAESLTKFYGLKPAVQDISFHVDRCEVVGLLGPNGAGKTTVLRMLTCFMPPTSGRVLVDDLDSRTQSLEVRRRIGFLPENVPLYSDMTVVRFLRFSGSVKGLTGKGLNRETDRIADICGLSEHKRRLIKHLSKGLKQRAGLAQALINDPPILVLDEPTTGLDPAQIIEIRGLIRRLGQEKTVLLSTHILPEASQICKRVIIVNRGRVIAEDRPENLTHRLQLEKKLETVFEIEGPPEKIRQILFAVDGVSEVKTTHGQNVFTVFSVPDENMRPALATAVVQAGLGLREMRSKDFSLEDVFVHLVTEEKKDMKT